MKTLALAAAAAVAVATPASATDLTPRRQPLLPSGPMAAPPSDWGFYAGVNGGAGSGDARFGFPAAQGAIPGDTVATRPDGAFAGAQIGFIRQFGPWLFGLPVMFGVEFTGAWTGLRETVAATPDLAPGALTAALDDLETVTARFGVTLDKWLLYAKAGGATGSVTLRALSAGAAFDQSSRAIGTTFAGGIEYGLTANLVVGVEYDFVRLFPGPFTGTAANGAVITADQPSFDVHAVAGRLSYRF